jgi:hypothetical protein
VSFWSRGRRGKESNEGPDAFVAAGPKRLAVVEFWGPDHRTVAAVDLSQERLADMLNRDDFIPVLPLDAPPEDRSQPIEARPGQAWAELDVAESLLVLPPPQATNPSRRLHRPRQPVEVLIGPFVVSGMVHVPPGAQAAAFLFRHSVRFAALTRAAIRDSGLAGFEQRADVVLVNMRHVRSMQDAGLDEGDALVPPEASAPNF